MKTVYLYLKSFSGIGGVEKVSKVLAKALYELKQNQISHLRVLSAYDQYADERYVDHKDFKGYGGNRIHFFLVAILKAYNADTLLLAHINLAPIAIAVKLVNPSIKIILIAHGIEVWPQLGFIKRFFLKQCDLILAVSQFTKDKILKVNKVSAEKIYVLNNALDPYFKIPINFKKPSYLQERYGLKTTDKVLLTLTRMTSFEKFKGYERVIEAVALIKYQIPAIRYLLAGKCDIEELARLNNLIDSLGLAEQVQLIGFVSETELTDHFLLADIFVMPSKKEGFGIVFIEALACGLNVIAGNKDGSIDAVRNNDQSTLVDPDNTEEIKEAIVRGFEKIEQITASDKLILSTKISQDYGLTQYCQQLTEILGNLCSNGNE